MPSGQRNQPRTEECPRRRIRRTVITLAIIIAIIGTLTLSGSATLAQNGAEGEAQLATAVKDTDTLAAAVIKRILKKSGRVRKPVEEPAAAPDELSEHLGKKATQATIPVYPLGINAVGYQTPETVAGMNVKWVHFGRIIWGEIEPSKGNIDYARLNKMKASVDDYVASGASGYMTLRSARSTWATETPIRPDSSAPPKNLDEWSGFVTTVVRQFPNVKYWRIENEIIASIYWSGTEQEYADLLRASSQAIKKVNPQAKVISGATTGWVIPMVYEKWESGDRQSALELYKQLTPEDRNPLTPLPQIETIAELEQVLEQSLKRSRVIEFFDYLFSPEASQYYDIMDVHIYNPHRVVDKAVTWHRYRMRENGFEKPIWLTESAGMIYPSADPLHPVKYSVAGLAAGANRVFYFPAMDFKMIAAHSDKRVAFDNYALLSSKLDTTTGVERLNLGPDLFGFKFARKDSGPVYVLWSDNGNQELSLAVDLNRVNIAKAATAPTIATSTQIPVVRGQVNLTVSEVPTFLD